MRVTIWWEYYHYSRVTRKSPEMQCAGSHQCWSSCHEVISILQNMCTSILWYISPDHGSIISHTSEQNISYTSLLDTDGLTIERLAGSLWKSWHLWFDLKLAMRQLKVSTIYNYILTYSSWLQSYGHSTFSKKSVTCEHHWTIVSMQSLLVTLQCRGRQGNRSGYGPQGGTVSSPCPGCSLRSPWAQGGECTEGKEGEGCSHSLAKYKLQTADINSNTSFSNLWRGVGGRNSRCEEYLLELVVKVIFDLVKIWRPMGLGLT